jgi:tetratricopeptide (TPR) repeat protein
MPEPQSPDQALVVLRELIEEHSSVHHVARCLGMSHGNLGRVLSGEYRMNFDLVGKILGVLGLPVSIFHRRCLDSHRLSLNEASALLRLCQPRAGRRRSARVVAHGAYLGKIDELFPAWLDSEPKDQGGDSRREEFLRLDDERFRDAASVVTSLGELTDELLQGPATRGRRADLAMLLAIWATVKRIEGGREEARDSYLYSMECLEGLDEAFIEGFVYQKAAYVAMDFDQFDTSMLLLDGAQAAFVYEGNLEWQARVFADKGYAHARQELWQRAETHLLMALRLLPASSARHRLAATDTLVEICLRTGRLEEANQALKEVGEYWKDTPLATAFVGWRSGKILATQQRHAEAVEQLWTSLATMSQVGEPIDAAILAVDLAEGLLNLGRKSDLRALVGDMVAWMGRLADNKDAHRTMVQFVRMFYANELTGNQLSALRGDLENASRRGRRPVRASS